MNLGATTDVTLKAGSTSITKAYRGSTQVYTSNSDNIFSVIHIPDTDELSRYCRSHDTFNQMMTWIVNNQATYNIKMVMSPGDVHGELGGTTCSNPYVGQFAWVSAAYTILDNAGIPYLISPANHDMESDNCIPRTPTSWDSTYPVSRFSSQTGFGGNYNNKSHTMYNVQTLGGKKFMFLTPEQLPSDAVVTWITGEIDTVNPDYIIIGFQETIKPDNSFATDADLNMYAGQTGVNAIDDLFTTIHDVYPSKCILTFGQSYLNSNNAPDYDWGGKATRTSGGYTQNFAGANFGRIDAEQTTEAACGNRAFFLIYTFNVANKTIDVKTYNPINDVWRTTDTAENHYQYQFSF